MMSSGASANQYLRPEYLTPLPTTLDAKKSPLALLAQTCSQIGSDSPNSKLLQSSEKSKPSKAEASREKSSPASSTLGSNNDVPLKSSFKPYEPTPTREKTRSPEDRSSTSSSAGSRVRTPVTKSNGGRCASNHSAVSPRSSPQDRRTPASETTIKVHNETPTKSIDSSSSSASSITTTASAPKASLSVMTSSTDHTVKDLPLGTFKPGSIPVSTASYLSSPYASHGLPPLPMELMASSLMSHHAFKSGALSPYLSYARMKNSAGGDSLVPVCRDPYCTGCSLSSHLLGNGKTPTTSASCPAGCAQCDHAAGKPSYLSHNPAAAAYAHAQLAALAAASQLPYVCNWIAGDAQYCGKRFGTSDELLQHLRTHTSLAVSESSAALSMLNSASIQAHPLLHRTYPTPPLSPLATARYHPYSKPSLLPPSLSGFPLGHPGLSPYFSPYSLYGPRLGAAGTMHP